MKLNKFLREIKPMDELRQEYKRIKKHHWESERHFFARVNLPSSIVRVFKAGTKKKIFKVLVNIDVKKLGTIRSQEKFRVYFEKNLSSLARVINKTNKGNNRVYPGYKWGHGTKILCLFLRDMVLHSHHFSDKVANRLSYYLYTPIDNVVIGRLEDLDVPIPFSSIKEIDSSKKFYDLQYALCKASSLVGVPRVWFDDNWAERL